MVWHAALKVELHIAGYNQLVDGKPHKLSDGGSSPPPATEYLYHNRPTASDNRKPGHAALILQTEAGSSCLRIKGQNKLLLMLMKQISNGEYTDLQLNGRTLFSIHNFEGAHYIREEVGIASTTLPEGFENQDFKDLETAIAYCQSETRKFFNDDSIS